MDMLTPNVLLVAGFDPSAGAGVLADVKTAEACGAYGLGVISSLTYQNDTEFDDVDWVETEKIIRQIHVLKRRLPVAAVKIGLVADAEALQTIVDYVSDSLGDVPIVWDPILKATAGFEFHGQELVESCPGVLRKLTLVTPNIPECEALFGTSDIAQLQVLVRDNGLPCILLKGGHSTGNESTDYLVTASNIINIPGVKFPGFQKHGTGCILSSAIASYLAQGKTLEDACKLGKTYVARAITSNEGLLATHFKP